MRILVAPDKFAGTLTARQAADAIAAGWRRASPDDELTLLPMSDGGPGFVDVVGEPDPNSVHVEAARYCGLDRGLDPWNASLQGSAARPYAVAIRLTPFTDAEWGRAEEALANEALFLAALLAGEMPRDVERAFTAAGLSLFPARPDELRSDCSCPDWANPCKHVAATYYILAEAFDADPFLVMCWRGRPRDDLLVIKTGRISMWVTDVAPGTHGGTIGGTYTMRLVLDTSAANWTLRAFLDDYEFDLNGSGTAGTTYTFGTNPTSQYVGFSNGVNGATDAESVIDNFQLNFTPVPEPSAALLGLLVVASGCATRNTMSGGKETTVLGGAEGVVAAANELAVKVREVLDDG